MEVLEVLDVMEVQVAVVLVELVDNDAVDAQPVDATVENDDAEKVQIIVMVVVDDDEVVDDDYTETVVIDEMVDIMDYVKLAVENDEKVEILDVSEKLEMVVQMDERIHETVEKVVIDEIDILDETDIQYDQGHQMLHELVENEYYVVELVVVHVIMDEVVVMQLQMFIDSI